MVAVRVSITDAFTRIITYVSEGCCQGRAGLFGRRVGGGLFRVQGVLSKCAMRAMAGGRGGEATGRAKMS